MTSNSKNFKKELVIKSTTENLSKVRDFTKSSAEAIGFSKEAIGKIILAVDEACSNVIKHAYKYSEEGEISVSLNYKDPKFVISITDEGTHFDPDLIPEPDIKEYHKQKKVGGLGMFLMKKLMDEVKYKNLSDNRNQVILVKYFQ